MSQSFLKNSQKPRRKIVNPSIFYFICKYLKAYWIHNFKTYGLCVFITITSKLWISWARWVKITKKKCFTCIKNCELKEKLISVYMIALVALEWRVLGFKLLLCHQATVLGAFSLKGVGFQIPLYTLSFRVLAFGISRVVTIITHHRAQSGEHFGTFRNLYYGCGNNFKMMFIGFVFTYLCWLTQEISVEQGEGKDAYLLLTWIASIF